MAPNSSSSNSSLPVWISCFLYGSSSSIYMSFSITNTLLLLPLCCLVLHVGLQQWRRSRSVSLLDVFTYNMVAVELLSLVGCNLNCVGIFRKSASVLLIGIPATTVVWFGQNFFHVLTCVERYLAVVRPVAYLKLRNRIWIRKVTVASVDLLCLVLVYFSHMPTVFLVLNLLLSAISFVIICFCSLSVLRGLVGPGPGEQWGKRQRVEQSKRRAFYTITVILGVLCFRLAGGVVWSVLLVYGGKDTCSLLVAQIWLDLPSSLVLPLLFLHRERK